MRAVVQRVARAEVEVDGAVVGVIPRGLLVLVCAMAGDDAGDAAWLVDRLPVLRVFPDDTGKMNRSVADLAGDGPAGILVVSQFTLSADLSPGLSKGTRPSFTRAASPEPARAAVDAVVAGLRQRAPQVLVETGRFAADMKVTLVNDGPVTLWLDTRAGRSEEHA